jgi:ribonuclease HII
MANLEYESKYYEKGLTLIAGSDEAGRGPLAGPLVVAACILPKGYQHELINDSKKLTDKKRRMLYETIKKDALAYHIEVIDIETIDKINIYQASKLGMKICLEKLSIKPEAALLDAMNLDMDYPVESIIKGDEKSLSIAAASILAKVYRDDLMIEYSKEYPQYQFDKNKGYGTKVHLEALDKYGITPLHRKTYEPVKSMLLPTLF